MGYGLRLPFSGGIGSRRRTSDGLAGFWRLMMPSDLIAARDERISSSSFEERGYWSPSHQTWS